MKTTLKNISASFKPRTAFAVLLDGVVTGFICKYRDTKTEKHPWQAFYYPRKDAVQILGSHYPSNHPAATNAKQCAVDEIMRLPADKRAASQAAYAQQEAEHNDIENRTLVKIGPVSYVRPEPPKTDWKAVAALMRSNPSPLLNS